MDEASLATTRHMLMRLGFAHQTPKLRVDPSSGFAKEEATELNGVIPAMIGFTADAVVHDPKDICLINEVFYYLRREHQLFGGLDRLMDVDHLVHRQIDRIVAIEEPAFDQLTYDWQLRYPGDKRARRESRLEQLDEPYRASHLSLHQAEGQLQ